jgi:dTDP-4-dehydrorhamnose reductase
LARIVITGASGLLGANALHAFRDELEVVGLHHRHPIRVARTTCMRHDLTDFDATAALLASLKPDYVLHCAALTDVDRCEAERELATLLNVGVPEFLGEACARQGIRLVHVSTDAFFDGEAGRYFTEEDPPTPVNFYGRTKALAEERLLGQAAAHLIVRTNFYGWNFQDKQSLAEWVLAAAGRSDPIGLYHDVRFTPLLANTLCRMLAGLMRAGATGIYHAASNRSISKADFGERVIHEFGLSAASVRRVSVRDRQSAAPRATNMALSMAKTRAVLAGADVAFEDDLREFRTLRERGYAQELKSAC